MVKAIGQREKKKLYEERNKVSMDGFLETGGDREIV